MPTKQKREVDAKVSQMFSYMNEELNINNDKGRLRSLSFDCIYGTDANPRMARTAKMNMIMHGDGHGGVHHHDGLLNVNGIFENRFNVILTNPPFGSRVEKDLKITEADRFTDEAKIAKYKERYGDEYEKALRQVNDNVGKSLLKLYKIDSGLTEVLFIERCLNLLKPGGRMGIVLPEGVLNNTNLQKAREFVEGKAKILLIVSIPQDVFIASGATVKPSLLFFKKFSEEEESNYNQISYQARIAVSSKYKDEIKDLEEQLKKRGKDALSKDEKKACHARLKVLQEKIDSEVRYIVKEKFDYEIPIAEVKKAGISTTGAEIENELIPLAKEFKNYREEHAMWDIITKTTSYDADSQGKLYRQFITNNVASEPQVFYSLKK